jgi:stearoyl-CoA desaturase (delta-9 desaturase)
MFAITGGYHRYFSHRTYKTSRAFQFFMACLAQSSAQKGAMWWAANHRHHHKFSDQAEDIHSPLHTGFFWSHVGWILCEENDRTQWELIPDFKKFPELVWLDRYPHVPALALALILFAAGGFPALAWGFFMSTALLWHGTFTINSLSHVYGTRRYTTTDTSRNNFWLALLTLGEGWHNNHHCYQSSTNQGFFWWEIDITYYVLKGLSKIGVVWDLRKPPLELLESKRIDRGVRDAMPRTASDTVKKKPATAIEEPAAMTASV